MKKIIKPHSSLIENVAANIAAEFYEIGRTQGLHSKHKTPRAYARANFEKFIPNAVKHLMDMLGSSMVSENEKQAIYDALLERANDSDLSILDSVKKPSVNNFKLPDNFLKGLH